MEEAMSATGHRLKRRAKIEVRASLRKRLFLNRFLRSDFARHGLLVFASSTLVNFSSYAFNFALSRWLGVTGYGLLASVVAGLVVASIPGAIFTTVIVKHSAELHAVEDEGRLAALAGTTLRFATIVGACAIAVVVLVHRQIAEYLKIGDTRIILLTGAILGASLVVTMLRGLLQGTQKFRRFAVSSIIEGGLRGVLGIAFVLLGFGVIGAIAGWLTAEAIALAYIFWALPQLRTRSIHHGSVNLDWRRIAYSSGAVGISAIAMTTLGFSDMILVRHFFNARAAGLYGALSLCGRVFTFGLSFLPTIMLPKATARAARGQSAFPILIAAGAVSATLAFVVIGFLALSPRLALDILVGPAYRNAAPLVMPYCIAATFLTLTSLVITYKTALHRFDFLAPILVVAVSEIVLIHLFHHSIRDVVTILVWGNLIALFSSSWRLSKSTKTSSYVGGPREEPHACAALGTEAAGPSLRIIIPAHNEEQRISPTVRDYCEHFGDRAVVTVVANACSDGSVSLLRKLSETYSNLDFVDIPARIGKGGAIRTGFKLGKEPYIGFVDADGATAASEYDRLFGICVEQKDCGIIGSRWRKGSKILRHQPILRRLASRTFNSIVRLCFGLPYTDTQCGAKIFRRSAVENAIADLELADFAFDIDLLTNLRAQGCRIVEVPTTWTDALSGTTVKNLGRTSLAMLGGLARLRLRRSFLACVPYIEWIAHESVIRANSRLSMLVLRDSRTSAKSPHRIYIDAARIAWEGAGHAVTTIEVSGFTSRLATLLWYVFVSARRFDAIVEECSTFPLLIPRFSVKPAYLAQSPGNSSRGLGQFLFDRLYHRVRRVEVTDDRAGDIRASLSRGELEPTVELTELEQLLEHVRINGEYRAAFAKYDGSWHITFREPESNLLARQKITVERAPR